MPDASESQAMTPFWQDKGIHVLLLYLATLISNAITAKFGFSIPPEHLLAFGGLVATYIVGHKIKSGTVLAAEIARDAALSAPPATTAAEAAKALDAIP